MSGIDTEEGARETVVRWLAEAERASEEAATARRRAAGLVKVIDGLVMVYPSCAELLPDGWPNP